MTSLDERLSHRARSYRTVHIAHYRNSVSDNRRFSPASQSRARGIYQYARLKST